MAETYSDKPTLEKWNQLAALAEVPKSPFVKLLDVSGIAATTQYDLDVIGIDWEKWQSVHIDALLKTAQQITLYVNGVIGGNAGYNAQHYSHGGGADVYLVRLLSYGASFWAPRVTLPVGRCAARSVQAWDHNGCGISSVSYGSLQTLNFVGSIGANARIVVWGEA